MTQAMSTGEIYGKYRLIERIASGGMAEIFKGVAVGEAGFEKPVAIKRLHARWSEDQDLVAMLQDEARLCSQLNHGNICQVLDLGLVGDTYYIAMEYVNGKDLFAILRQASRAGRPLPLAAALYIGCEMLAGLDYAHRKTGPDGAPLHIIHRDISPQNVLVTFAGEVKIIDFGIAKARTSTHRTQAGIIKGKFRYMSPEQARGEPIDHRTDIFAAGVVLYEMILGRPHSGSATDREILIKIQTGRFERLGALRPGLPHDLEALVHRSLALSPDDRWNSARAFRKALLDLMRQEHMGFTRDDLGEYMREAFAAEAPRRAAVEELEPLADEDILPASGVHAAAPAAGAPRAAAAADTRDPFALDLPPVLSSPRASPTEATRRLTPEEAQAVPTPQRGARARTGKEKPPAKNKAKDKGAAAASRRDLPAVVVEDAALRERRAEPSARRRREATEVTARERGEKPKARAPGKIGAALSYLLRGLFTLGLLGLVGYGGYQVYLMYYQKPAAESAPAPDDGRPARQPAQPKYVLASLEIDSVPSGAAISLGGQEMGVQTPRRFPDLRVPTALLVELHHPKWKTPWRRVIPVGEGDRVRFVADLAAPPAYKGTGPGTASPARLPPPDAPRAARREGRGGGDPAPARPREPAAGADVARLSVTADVNGAEVLINGQVRGTTPFQRPVRPATFTIQVRKGDRASEVRQVKLAPGEQRVVRFHLGL